MKKKNKGYKKGPKKKKHIFLKLFSFLLIVSFLFAAISAAVFALTSSQPFTLENYEEWATHVREVEQTNEELSTLKEQALTLQAQLQSAEEAYVLLEADNAILEADKVTLAATIVTLQNNLATVQSTIDVLQSENSVQASTITNLQAEIVTLNETISSLNAIIASYENNDQVAQLEAYIAQLEAYTISDVYFIDTFVNGFNIVDHPTEPVYFNDQTLNITVNVENMGAGNYDYNYNSSYFGKSYSEFFNIAWSTSEPLWFLQDPIYIVSDFFNNTYGDVLTQIPQIDYAMLEDFILNLQWNTTEQFSWDIYLELKNEVQVHIPFTVTYNTTHTEAVVTSSNLLIDGDSQTSITDVSFQSELNMDISAGSYYRTVDVFLPEPVQFMYEFYEGMDIANDYQYIIEDWAIYLQDTQLLDVTLRQEVEGIFYDFSPHKFSVDAGLIIDEVMPDFETYVSGGFVGEFNNSYILQVNYEFYDYNGNLVVETVPLTLNLYCS